MSRHAAAPTRSLPGVATLHQPVRLNGRTVGIVLVVAWLTAIACVGMYRLANPPHHDRSLRDCEADWLTYLRTYQGSLGVEAEPSATDAHTWAQSVGCTQWEPFN